MMKNCYRNNLHDAQRMQSTAFLQICRLFILIFLYDEKITAGYNLHGALRMRQLHSTDFLTNMFMKVLRLKLLYL